MANLPRTAARAALRIFGAAGALGLLLVSLSSPRPDSDTPRYHTPAPYQIIVLPIDRANSINDSGQIVGEHRGRAVLWQNGAVRDLGVLPESESYLGPGQSAAADVNSRGQVVGSSGQLMVHSNGSFDARPFLWERGKMHTLGTLGGNFARAQAVNARGDVVGGSERDQAYRFRTGAFLWRNAKMRHLGTPEDVDGRAHGINDRGQVVGDFLRPGLIDLQGRSSGHAFLWESGRMRDLGTLPGYESSSASAINNRGQVVGELSHPSVDYGTRSRAFLWERGRMRMLPTPGGYDSVATSINDPGQIVGHAAHHSNLSRALLWRSGRMHDLNDLIPNDSGCTLINAHDINNRGQIVGVGLFKGKRRGFLLTPCSEARQTRFRLTQRRRTAPAPAPS